MNVGWVYRGKMLVLPWKLRFGKTWKQRKEGFGYINGKSKPNRCRDMPGKKRSLASRRGLSS